MSGKKQFYYMGDKGNEVLRIKQILALHVAKNLKYDSDMSFIVQVIFKNKRTLNKL